MITLNELNSQRCNLLLNRAKSAQEAHDLAEAKQLLFELLAEAPECASAHNLLGHVYYQAGQLDEALRHFREASLLGADNDDHLCDYGLLLNESGHFAEAARIFRHVLLRKPGDANVHLYLADALAADGERHEALAAYTDAVGLRPDHVPTLLNLGVLLESMDLLDEALTCMKRALTHNPPDARIVMNIGGVLQSMGRVDEAEDYFRQALALSPSYGTATWNLAQIRLLKGDFGTGWHLFQSRFRKSDPVAVRHGEIPLWRGEDLRGKVLLVWGEQAFGDIIQFCRFLPLLTRTFGCSVHFESSTPTLDSLLASLNGDLLHIRPATDQTPACDYAIPLMSVPGMLGVTLDTIPAGVPYLHPGSGSADAWRQRVGASRRPRIGIAWQGRQKPDPRRSMPFPALEPLAGIPGPTWYSLQVDRNNPPGTEDIKGLPLIDLTDHIHDFEDTAALISTLDLVLTIDTAVAHLAGALGVQTWVMLPFMPDWRWLLERSDSPWYPTMRLFRQPRPGDWRDVVERVGTALQRFVQSTGTMATRR